ncbi:MAG TPA: LysE family translocator [Hyphomicrobiaceae bacterium]|jgi:threonine/homoserine/homoserine lactone efflux protein
MDITHLLVFAAAYLAVVLLPGPGVTALVARVLTRGTHGAPAYIAGFVTGSLLWFTVAAAGLAALASAFGALFTVIRYAGAIYLVYLAWKFWTAPARPFNAADTSPEGRWPLFLAGAAINLGNPKAVVFFLALLPTILDLDTLTAVGFAELSAIVAVIVSAVFSAYAVAAERARRLFSSPRAVRLLNRGSAMALAGTAAAVATR